MCVCVCVGYFGLIFGRLFWANLLGSNFGPNLLVAYFVQVFLGLVLGLFTVLGLFQIVSRIINTAPFDG